MTYSNVTAHQWQDIQNLAQVIIDKEPSLVPFLKQCVMSHATFGQSLSCVLSNEIAAPQLSGPELFTLFSELLAQNPDIIVQVSNDLSAYVDRDPACTDVLTAFLYFKGFHALQLYRIAHKLWQQQRYSLALYIQSRCSQEYDVDIHPAATLGSSIMIDHATGVVIGETSVVEDNVSILHGVTLGGNGIASGDRHPKIRRGVLISTGAKILGNVEVGIGAKVAASSLVVESVPAHTTVAGVPAKVVGKPQMEEPSCAMHHNID